jgi:hypothetical protein
MERPPLETIYITKSEPSAVMRPEVLYVHPLAARQHQTATATRANHNDLYQQYAGALQSCRSFYGTMGNDYGSAGILPRLEDSLNAISSKSNAHQQQQYS